MSENNNSSLLIKRTMYTDSSALTFGKSYCKKNTILLRTLIVATHKLESTERNQDFLSKLKKQWLDEWEEEDYLKNNYNHQSIKDDFFNFGYHIGIWDGNYYLSDLAKQFYKKRNDEEELKKYFSKILLNYVITFENKSYNPLILVLEFLKERNKNTIETSDLKTIFMDIFKKNNKKEENSFFGMWKFRILHLLLTSSEYFFWNKKSNNRNTSSVFSGGESIDELIEKCNKKYHNKPVIKIQLDITDQNKKTLYLTTGQIEQQAEKLTEEQQAEKIELIKKSIILEQPHQLIYFGAPGVGKSYSLNLRAFEFFEEENIERIVISNELKYSELVWKKESNKIILGILIKQIIKAIVNFDENFLLIIEDIGNFNYLEVFGDFIQLFDRNDKGISKNKIKINTLVEEQIEKQIKEEEDKLSQEKKKYFKNYYKDYEDGMILNQGVFFPKNLYIWSTMNSFNDWNSSLNNYFRRRWEFKYIDINNEENIINKFDFTLKNFELDKNNKVNWNKFRKIINLYLSSVLDVKEGELLGTFFISIETLEWMWTRDLLFKIIQNKVLFYLYNDFSEFYFLKIFNKEYATNFSLLYKNFEEEGFDVFSDELKDFFQKWWLIV